MATLQKPLAAVVASTAALHRQHLSHMLWKPMCEVLHRRGIALFVGSNPEPRLDPVGRTGAYSGYKIAS